MATVPEERKLTLAGDISEMPTYKYASVLRDIIDDETRVIFQWVCCAVLGQTLALLGLVTNVLNIICFVKQGFRDPVNISLLVTWTNTCYNPALVTLDLTFDPGELQLLIGTWPSVTFNHVTSCITAFITVERCLCVSMPIKVKAMMTPRNVTLVIVSIYLFIISAVVPIYCVSSHGWKFSPQRNKTILGIVFTEHRVQTEQIAYAFNNIIIPFTAFGIVIICTMILVIALRSKAKWRKQSTAPVKSEQLSTRDRKIARMMIMIAILFVATFFPVCVVSICLIAVPQLSMDGRFKNSLFSIGSAIFILQSTNSATNIFIYYSMSSRYRNVFLQAILCQHKVD